MAIANSDGSIILSTKVDTSGINKGMSQIQSKATTITKTFSKLGGAIASAFAIQKIIQFNNEAGQLATQTEASVQRLIDIYGEASESVGNFIDQNSKTLGLSKSVGASIASTYGNLLSVWADQATNAELTNALLNQTAVVASRTGRTTTDVAERIRSGLLGNTEAIEDLGINVNIKTIEITDAFKKIADGRSWEQLNAYEQAQVRTLAILEQATAKYGDEVADTSATIRNRFNAAYQDFQNSWGNIVNTVLLPALETLTQIFDIATKGLNVLSGRSGQILENVELQEENTDKTTENIKEQTKNQKELNNEVKKTLAGFDDIQILSANTAKNTSGGLSNELQGLGGDLGGIVPDGSSYVDEINETLAAIMQTVAISMIAIGLILLFTGNVGWGIGAIIFGLGLEGVTAASITKTDPSTEITKSLLALQSVVVGASVALGIMMIFMGSKALGVSLIAYGAVQLGVTIYEITQFDTNPIESTINVIQGVAAGAMLALGFFLLYFKVNMPLAISLIAGGALLVVDEIFDIVEGGVSPEISAWIDKVMLLIEGAALVIGIILLATGVNIPLGISLVATSAFALGKEVFVNWDTIAKRIKTAFQKIKDWIIMYGGLVLGIILLFTGTLGATLGMALIIDSVSSLGKGEKPLLWDSILQSIKTTWNNIKTYWNKNIADIWTIDFWLGLAKIAGNGLIDGFELSINGIIGMFEKMINWIVDGLNSISFDIPEWLGGGHFGFDISNVEFGRVSIPRLAKGAVIPPNREFLAVLGDQKQGTNIEAPLQTIVDAFNIALQNNGAGQTTKEEHYYLNETEVMSIIYKLAKGGERLQGNSLISGGVR